MTTEQVQERLRLVCDPFWSFHNVETWFGIDLEPSRSELLESYRVWTNSFRHSQQLLNVESGQVSRSHLELFLQERELTTQRAAAVGWGMKEESFQRTWAAAKSKGFITSSEEKGEFVGIYRATLIRDFHRRFQPLKFKIFATYPSFIESLHRQIAEVLDVTVTPEFCLTAKALGRTDYARSFDIISNEPMSHLYDVWLITGKPIQLRPDSCSWLTFVKHEDVLGPLLMGQRDPGMEQNRERLLAYDSV